MYLVRCDGSPWLPLRLPRRSSLAQACYWNAHGAQHIVQSPMSQSSVLQSSSGQVFHLAIWKSFVRHGTWRGRMVSFPINRARISLLQCKVLTNVVRSQKWLTHIICVLGLLFCNLLFCNSIVWIVQLYNLLSVLPIECLSEWLLLPLSLEAHLTFLLTLQAINNFRLLQSAVQTFLLKIGSHRCSHIKIETLLDGSLFLIRIYCVAPHHRDCCLWFVLCYPRSPDKDFYHNGKGRTYFSLSNTVEYLFWQSQQPVQKVKVFIYKLLEGLLWHRTTKDDFVDHRPA